jgi:hypothetical protein
VPVTIIIILFINVPVNNIIIFISLLRIKLDWVGLQNACGLQNAGLHIKIYKKYFTVIKWPSMILVI